MTDLYTPQSFFDHAALLRQTFVHCAKFLTAASRRSLGRISVPVWLIILSDQLLIIAMVNIYSTIQLIRRRTILQRKPKPPLIFQYYMVLAPFSRGYSNLHGRQPTRYSPVRQFNSIRRYVLLRLACVRHAASVHPEPGSNSPLYIFLFNFLALKLTGTISTKLQISFLTHSSQFQKTFAMLSSTAS